MDNMYPPTGDGDPQDSRRTDQFCTSPPGPAAGNPHDPAGPPAQPGYLERHGYLEQHYARDRRHALRWTVGLSVALVLAAGGVIAGVALAGHPPASSFSQASDSTAAHSVTGNSGTGSSAGAVGQPQSQAAALSSVLNAAGAPGTLTLSSAPAAAGGTAKAATKAAAGARVAACRRAVAALRAARRTGRPALIKAARKAVVAHCHGLLRRRLLRFALLRGVAGQFTFRTKQGTLRTLAFERGVVQSVSSSAIVVRAVNGSTGTWDLVSSTVVRAHGQKTSRSALTSGEPVWVGGPVLSGVNDARLIVIRPPSAAQAATPAPSASGS